MRHKKKEDVNQGPNFILVEPGVYSVFARFCEAFGKAWNSEHATDFDGYAVPIRETGCLSSERVMIIDNETGEVIKGDKIPRIP